MALNFPSSPVSGQTYQSGSSPYYIFNGNYWEIDKSYVINGTSGTSGTSGASGSSGSNGTSGTSGTSGIGSSGTSGTSGVGTNGTSGTAGTSGTSGTSPAVPASYTTNYVQVLGSQVTLSSGGQTMVSGSITTTGKPIHITVTGDANPQSNGAWCTMQIYRGSTAIGGIIQAESSNGNENVPFCLNVIDTPPSGTYTYSAKMNTNAGNFQFGEASGPLMTIMEIGVGTSGTSGSSGSNGLVGSHGTSGTSGSSGSSGTSGGTGSSGTSGTSGYVDNDWLHFRPSTSTIPSTGNNFVLTGTTTSNGSVSYNSATGIFTLAANKTYNLTAAFALANSVNNIELNYCWINVTNGNTQVGNSGALLVNSSNASAAWQPIADGIITTTGTTQVALKSIFTSATGGLNVGMCFVNIKQINGWSGTSGTAGTSGTSGTSPSLVGYAITGSNTFNGNQIITGSLTTTDFINITGAAGDEGGEINLALAKTNQNLTGSINIDVYRNQLRIFEGGGNARGVSIDLSKAPNGVGAELVWKTSGFVNAGTFLTLDNLKVTVTTSGSRGLSVGAVSTNFEADISGWYGLNGGGSGMASNNIIYTTTASTSLFNWSFPGHGDTAQYQIRDKTNNRFYRVTMMIGQSYISNFISIERLH